MLQRKMQEIRRLYHIHVCEDVHGNQRLPLEVGLGLWQPKVLQSNKHMFHVSKNTSSFRFLKFELHNSPVTIKVTCIFSFIAPICWCLCDRRWWDRWDQWKGESPASQRKAIRSTPWERWTCNERPMILSKSCYCTPPHFKDLRGKNANHTICVVYIMNALKDSSMSI